MIVDATRIEITDADKRKYPRFKHSNLTHELYSMQLDFTADVVIVGAPDEGCYEWMIRTKNGVEEYSDLGYGDPGIALRDGLIAFYGLPRPAIGQRPRGL